MAMPTWRRLLHSESEGYGSVAITLRVMWPAGEGLSVENGRADRGAGFFTRRVKATLAITLRVMWPACGKG